MAYSTGFYFIHDSVKTGFSVHLFTATLTIGIKKHVEIWQFAVHYVPSCRERQNGYESTSTYLQVYASDLILTI